MARAVRELGMRLYVGNMFVTSLAIAPAFLLGQVCDSVELDGAVFLARDRENPLRIQQGVAETDLRLWGWP